MKGERALLRVAFALIVAGLGPPGLWDANHSRASFSGEASESTGCGGQRIYSTKDPGVHAPRRLRAARPKYPDMSGHTFVGTPAIFDVVVNSKGVVCEIRTVKEPLINPPLPAYAAAIAKKH